MAAARILIVDDHPLFREALRHALTAGKADLEISEAGSLDALIARYGVTSGVDQFQMTSYARDQARALDRRKKRLDALRSIIDVSERTR